MKTEKSFNVQIWVGLRKGYTNLVYNMDNVRSICDEHIIAMDGDCVTITPTEFRYKDGWELGVVVGYINYPRFPRTEDEIKDRSLKLAKALKDGLGQTRVTVTTPYESIMLE